VRYKSDEKDILDMNKTPKTTPTVTRRTALGTLGAGAVIALAGCLGGDDEEGPDPVSLDGEYACDNCNMQIQMHPGPVGEAFYLDDTPEQLPEDREDGIARFCSSWCAYTYTLETAQRGPEPAQMYTTDYSTVEYELDQDGETTVISAHLGADAFGDVADLTYVVGSDVEGAMGGSLIGFSSESDAESFAADHGGELLTHDEVTLEVVQGL
jgi:copper chaperone NosL